MQVFIICRRKEDGTWEGKVKIKNGIWKLIGD